MKIEKLFGDDLETTQEEFANFVSLTLTQCWNDRRALLLDGGSLYCLSNLMSQYRGFIESRDVPTADLERLLSCIVVISLNEFSPHLDSFNVLKALLIRKNADYGNASIKNGGLVGNYVRLSDKLSRLQNFEKKKGETILNFEKIKDTWLDTAGYAVIGSIILRLTDKKHSEDT